MPTVRLPSALRKYADDQRTVEVEATRVGEALTQAVVLHPSLRIRFFDDDGGLHPHLLVILDDEELDRDRLNETSVGSSQVISLLIAVSGGVDDVRMRGFRNRSTVEETRKAALEGVRQLPPEDVGIHDCVGRVLAEAVVSTVNVPGFRRATMDGYALHAADSYGATAYNPLSLKLLGAAMPGTDSGGAIPSGSAVRIMTGAPVPGGADAVLRAEDARETGGVVEALAPVAEGKNIGRIGEDVEVGATVLEAGRRLLPPDVGLLSSIGHSPRVVRRPVVRVIVSGDELLPPGEVPSGNRIVDSNSPMLAALVRRDGGLPEVRRLPDDESAMRAALQDSEADVIVTAGAASVGSEDRVPLLVAELGELLIHGVTMRPSSPTGIGRIGRTPVLILPGNPVSCLVAYDFFAGPVIRRLGGLTEEWPYRKVRLPLRTRLVSQIGRTDYARVVVGDGMVEPLAISGASVLSSVTSASGFVVVPAGLEGFGEGAEVEVHLYEDPARP